MKNKTLLLLCFWINAVSIMAQSNESIDERQQYSSSILENWFVQAGVDMTLQNPYGSNFLNTFSKGKTYGINASIGRWFSPEIAAKVRINWDNWLIENDYLEWVAPFGRNGENYRKGGFGEIVFETHFNIHNIFWRRNSKRVWSMTIFPRMGLVSNFAVGSCSPLIGFGIENLFRLNKKLWLYLDIAYQMTTSEFAQGNINTGNGTGSNGFLNIDIGLGINLGKHRF